MKSFIRCSLALAFILGFGRSGGLRSLLIQSPAPGGRIAPARLTAPSVALSAITRLATDFAVAIEAASAWAEARGRSRSRSDSTSAARRGTSCGYIEAITVAELTAMAAATMAGPSSWTPAVCATANPASC